jgi:hypothetical protein
MAEDGARDIEGGGELALRRQPVARAQHAVEDALLDLPNDGVGRPIVNDALKHCMIRDPDTIRAGRFGGQQILPDVPCFGPYQRP